MRGMNSASVDLIYLDPPFNSNANYAAPIGSEAAGAEFKDTWGLNDINLAWHGIIKYDYPALHSLLSTVREVHSDSMMSYLIYIAIRIIEMRRLLKDTGSIYLHCDPTASHYLKLLMDCIFGRKNYRNEIIWAYRTGGVSKRWFGRKHDVLLAYGRSGSCYFNPVKEKSYLTHKYGFKNIEIKQDAKGWYRNIFCRDWWIIEALRGNHPEAVGYPTQKPLRLIERIIKASSKNNDIVLDPFCGCATACIAAEAEQRQWVGIDISPKAADLVQSRLRSHLGLFYQGAHRNDIPKRTDFANLAKYNSSKNKKFLYGEQGGYCLGCKHHFKMRHMEVDHIIPKSKGGTDHISNLQQLCGSCNRIKGAETHEVLIARLTDKGYIKRNAAYSIRS